jgi:hypothetical protein
MTDPGYSLLQTCSSLPFVERELRIYTVNLCKSVVIYFNIAERKTVEQIKTNLFLQTPKTRGGEPAALRPHAAF